MALDRATIASMLEARGRLDIYLLDVQERRETNRQVRRRTYIEQALIRLHEELLGALEDEDAEIAEELEQVTAAFEAVLADSLGRAPPHRKSEIHHESLLGNGPAKRNDSAGSHKSPPKGANDSVLLTAKSDGTAVAEAELSGNREAELLGCQENVLLVRKDDAVQAIIEWGRFLEEGNEKTYISDDDRELLFLLLDDCLAAGVSANEPRITAVLRDVASMLLVDQPRYGKFLKPILAERRRTEAKSDEVKENTEVEKDDFEQMLLNVVSFTRGKRVMMLGGMTRLKVQQQLSGLLECEVMWANSKPTDRARKFQFDLEKADVLLMVKNFARHQLFDKGKAIMRERDGHFIVLPSGYGVRQVVNQINAYIAREQSTRHDRSQPRAMGNRF